MADNAATALRELIEMGVPVQLDGNAIACRHLSGNTYARSVYHPNGIGRLAVDRLVELSDQQGIEKLAGWKAISLLHHASSRSEEHTSELQSLMRISYAVFCLKKKRQT